MAYSRQSHQALRRQWEAAKRDRNEKRFFLDVKEGLQERHLDPAQFSLRELYENFVPDGGEAIHLLNPRDAGSTSVLEAGENVNTAAFANITGQIVYTKVMEAFMNPAFIGDQLVTTIPTQFDGEKIPGIGLLGDAVETVGEGRPYPTVGLSEEWIETPRTIKRGLVVPVTKEAVFFDRLGLVLTRAGQVGEIIGVNKEKRIIDAVCGLVTLYRRNGAAPAATYGDTPFDNLAASNALVNYQNIEAAELLFDGLTDPNTGEPIVVTPDTLLCPSALKRTAQSILQATGYVITPGGFATSGTPVQMQTTQPVAFSIVSSPRVKARTSSASTWFYGQFKKAFAYMENWGLQVTKAGEDSEQAFTHDIVARFKASERGAAAVLEPRYVVKCTA